MELPSLHSQVSVFIFNFLVEAGVLSTWFFMSYLLTFRKKVGNIPCYSVQWIQIGLLSSPHCLLHEFSKKRGTLLQSLMDE